MCGPDQCDPVVRSRCVCNSSASSGSKQYGETASGRGGVVNQPVGYAQADAFTATVPATVPNGRVAWAVPLTGKADRRRVSAWRSCRVKVQLVLPLIDPVLAERGSELATMYV